MTDANSLKKQNATTHIITIVADDREKKVIPHFTSVLAYPQYKFLWEVRRMTHADYAIIWNNKLIALVERKRWNDLASSIVDKRILNIENLKILRERIGCCLIVMIEGKRPKRNAVKHGVSYAAMKSKLDHLIMRDHIHVDYSKNPNGTAIRLAELSKNFTTITDDIVFKSDEEHKQIIEEVMGMREQCEEITSMKNKKEAILGWCALPGVDLVTTGIIRRAGYSLADVIKGKLSTSELAVMKYPGSDKAVGFERATSIMKGVNKPETAIAILSSVRGVSKAKAKAIYADFSNSLTELLEDGTKNTIGNVKVGGRAVGKAVATKILNTLNAKITDKANDSDDD